MGNGSARMCLDDPTTTDLKEEDTLLEVGSSLPYHNAVIELSFSDQAGNVEIKTTRVSHYLSLCSVYRVSNCPCVCS